MTAMTISGASVSVLNATYERLGATKLSRALVLVARGDAVIEESDPLRVVSHKEGAFPWPIIIRLLKFVKVSLKYGPQMWTKHGVLKRDGFICGYCGAQATTIDHIHPQSRGGEDSWENTVAACAPCNHKKSDRLLKSIPGMALRVTPTVPMAVSIRSETRKRTKH